VAVISDTFVIEPSYTVDVSRIEFIAGQAIYPAILTPTITADVVYQNTLSGLPQIPTTIEPGLVVDEHAVVIAANMLVDVYIIPSKIINELDQVSSDKLVRPYGTLAREYWF
jgi:hypothetical protein